MAPRTPVGLKPSQVPGAVEVCMLKDGSKHTASVRLKSRSEDRPHYLRRRSFQAAGQLKRLRAEIVFARNFDPLVALTLNQNSRRDTNVVAIFEPRIAAEIAARRFVCDAWAGYHDVATKAKAVEVARYRDHAKGGPNDLEGLNRGRCVFHRFAKLE